MFAYSEIDLEETRFVFGRLDYVLQRRERSRERLNPREEDVKDSQKDLLHPLGIHGFP